ncbi:MFS transporter [Paenibacillus xylanexedens]|uniref:MFS transporter n=1 Tax=Paenibacillus xylanexedens TaxID=528191 RepID=UPI00119CC456|nr:MFS transporter [Paenibacillus xylanexedens]
MKNKTGFRQVLRNRNYMLLWIGQTVSQIGDAVTLVALPLLVYELTQSVMGLTLTFIIEAIPWIVVGPIAGVFIDRMNRFVLLVATDILRMLLIGVVFFTDHVGVIYGIAFLMQAMAAINTPVRSSIIPDLLDKELYVKAIGMSHTTFQTVQVIGPLVAAAILSMTGGPRPVFLLDSLTFMLCVGAAIMMKIPPRTAQVEQRKDGRTAEPPLVTFGQMFKVGASFLFTNRVMRYVTSINLLKSVVQSLVLVGTLLYVKSTMDLTASQGDRIYSLAVAAMAIGVISGTILITAFEKRVQRRYLITGGLFLQGVILIMMQFHPQTIWLLILLLIAGLGASGAMAPLSAYYAETTPNEIRGRVYSVTNSMLRIAGMAAYVLAGPVGEWYGPETLFLVVSVLLLVGMPILTLWLNGLYVLAPKPCIPVESPVRDTHASQG